MRACSVCSNAIPHGRPMARILGKGLPCPLRETVRQRDAHDRRARHVLLAVEKPDGRRPGVRTEPRHHSIAHQDHHHIGYRHRVGAWRELFAIDADSLEPRKHFGAIAAIHQLELRRASRLDHAVEHLRAFCGSFASTSRHHRCALRFRNALHGFNFLKCWGLIHLYMHIYHLL